MRYGDAAAVNTRRLFPGTPCRHRWSVRLGNRCRVWGRSGGPVLPRGIDRAMAGCTRSLGACRCTAIAALPRCETRRGGRLPGRELMENDWAQIADQTSWSDARFMPQVYQQVTSGKPRMSGALGPWSTSAFPTPHSGAANRQTMVVKLPRSASSRPIPTRCVSCWPCVTRTIEELREAGARRFTRAPPS